ncbi:decaprenyl-phosphate phosphoribosyltransferase [bacterium]|nr:decaprenyl-phosphate phosphoribosyltransferase [bacterium]
MTAIVALMRPQQWIKNIVVFAGVVFAGRLTDLLYLEHALAAFVVFCLASSGIYVFNDLLDVEKDRLHPEKRTRPIAAGTVGKGAALTTALVLWAAAGAAAFALGPRFGVTIVGFLVLNVLYSAWLKSQVIIDVLSISVSFMLRAIGGVQVLRDLDPTVALSHWLLLCTFFLALVMSFGKRRSELVLLDDSASSHRAALREYSVEFLDVIVSLVSACAILAYSIYTIWPETVVKLGTDKLVYTVPFVVYGFLRYLLLVRERGLGGNPSEILFRDRALLASVAAWAVAIVGILYFG